MHLCMQMGFGAHTCNISKALYRLVRKTDQQLKSEHNNMNKKAEIAKKRSVMWLKRPSLLTKDENSYC